MKKQVLTAIVSFFAGAAVALLAVWMCVGNMLSDMFGAGEGTDMQVSISTEGVSWDTPANRESVVLLFNNLPVHIQQMCRREYASKVTDSTESISLTYPDGELHFDWQQQMLQICSEGINLTVEGIDKAFCDELFLDR